MAQMYWVGQGDRSDFFKKNNKARKTNGSLIMQDLVGQVKGFEFYSKCDG